MIYKYLSTLQVLTSISQMVLETEQNINSKPIKMLIENFLSSISRDKIILSPRLLSVTENEVKIWSIFLISGLILLIMNLSNSRYVYSNLNLHFLHASLWCCTIHFKASFCNQDLIIWLNLLTATTKYL